MHTHTLGTFLVHTNANIISDAQTFFRTLCTFLTFQVLEHIWRCSPAMKVPMPRFIMACLGAGLLTVCYHGVKPALEFELNQRLSAVHLGYAQALSGWYGFGLWPGWANG